MLKKLSLVAYLIMVAGLLGLVFLKSLVLLNPVVIGFQALALALFVWARLTFGLRSFHAVANPTSGGLVTSGPYRYIRHPIYTALCLFCTFGVLAQATIPAALCLCFIWCGAVVRIACEEVLILERYPEYTQYKTNTWRMLPFLF